MKSVGLQFHGPLAWVHAGDAEFMFDADTSKKPGIYLWTVKTPTGHLVWYVGQTRASFRQRMKEHFKEQMSGSYGLNDPVLLAQGERKKSGLACTGGAKNGGLPSSWIKCPRCARQWLRSRRLPVSS